MGYARQLLRPLILFSVQGTNICLFGDNLLSVWLGQLSVFASAVGHDQNRFNSPCILFIAHMKAGTENSTRMLMKQPSLPHSGGIGNSDHEEKTNSLRASIFDFSKYCWITTRIQCVIHKINIIWREIVFLRYRGGRCRWNAFRGSTRRSLGCTILLRSPPGNEFGSNVVLSLCMLWCPLCVCVSFRWWRECAVPIWLSWPPCWGVRVWASVSLLLPSTWYRTWPSIWPGRWQRSVGGRRLLPTT